MSKHVDGMTCGSCQEKLKNAHPALCSWYNEQIKPNFADSHISWSYRDQTDQEIAFRDGKSKAHYPNSPHNKTDDQGNPCSLALDLFQLTPDGKAFWPVSYFHEIYSFCEKQNLSIIWGGEFKSIGDFDHFELKDRV